MSLDAMALPSVSFYFTERCDLPDPRPIRFGQDDAMQKIEPFDELAFAIVRHLLGIGDETDTRLQT